MATATVTPSSNVKTEVVTFYLLTKGDKQKTTIYEKDAEDYQADGWTLVGSQGIIRPEVSSMAGLAELIPDEEVQVDLVNRGLGTKFSQIVNTMLKKTDSTGKFTFEFTADNLDISAELARKPERIRMNPLDKALKQISASGLTAEQIATLIASLQQALPSGAESQDDSGPV